MAIADAIANDFENYVDNLELITLRRPGSSTVTVVPYALRRAVSTKEALASNGKYTQDDVVWHLPASFETDEEEPPTVQTVTPYVGDRIDPLGTGVTLFTILERHKETFASRWRCVTRDLAVANELNQLVTIMRRVVTRAGAAADYTEREEVKTGFKARIQIETTTRQTVQGKASALITARMFMSEPFELDNRYAILQADGTEWEVDSYLAPEDIGQLPIAMLERTL